MRSPILQLLPILVALLACHAPARAELNWNVGFREGGGGFFLSSPDHRFTLSLLGYGQFRGHIISSDYGTGGRADQPLGFLVRRTRFTAHASLYEDIELSTELGTPNIRAITAPAAAAVAVPTTFTYPTSDFGVVEARATARLSDDVLQLRVGKFTGPFSSENVRPTHRLDTAERSTAINSLMTFPALDPQVGAMLFGRFQDDGFHYFLGVFNGNGHSLGTDPDDNGDKEIQAKIVFRAHPRILLGVGYDFAKMPTRLAALVDHLFVPVITGGVTGTRHGFTADIDLTWDKFSWRAEIIYFTFPDSKAAGFMSYLLGVSTTFGLLVSGDANKGTQLIARYDFGGVKVGTDYALHSGILGVNVAFNPAVRYQANFVMELPTVAGTGAYAAKRVLYALVNEVQVRF